MKKVPKKHGRNKTWQKTAFPGIFYREVPDKKTGSIMDYYYVGWYSVNKKKFQIVFGSRNKYHWTPKTCADKMSEFRSNAKQGVRPRNFQEEQDLREEIEQAEREEQKRLERENVKFDNFFNEVYMPQAEIDKKPHTLSSEKSYFNNWIEPEIGRHLLKEVTVEDLDGLIRRMIQEGRTPRTIQYVLAIIRQVFNKAISSGVYNAINPVQKVKIPSINNERTRFLTKQEADFLLGKLVNTSKNLYETALLSLHTGMRAGEIHNLKWHDVDFDQGLIRIMDAKDAKRGSKTRYVYMTQKIKEILGKRKNKSPLDYLFAATNGKKRNSVSKAYYRVVEESGLNKGCEDERDRVCFHTLRHTFASWQVQNGMSLYELQRLMGHESFAMVQRYAHLAPENLKKATAVFEDTEEINKKPETDDKPENIEDAENSNDHGMAKVIPFKR